MDINLLKQLALMNFLNQEWFEYNGEFYEGNENEIYVEWKEKSDTQYIGQNYGEYIRDEIEKVCPYGEHYALDYLVFTDSEADERAYDFYYEYYKEEIPYDLQYSYLYNYIDLNQATLDTIRDNGRGVLSSYDDIEHEETIVIGDIAHTFYIYKQ